MDGANAPVYEILIPSHPKDHSKLPYVIERAFKYTDAQHIHIVAPDESKLGYLRDNSAISLYDDRDILPIGKTAFACRGGWVLQQFIKLFQNVTSNWFLGMDSDLLMNTKYPVFELGKPVITLARDPNQTSALGQYDRFTEKMLGISRAAPFGFLSDCTLYNRGVIAEMLSENGYTVDSFLTKAASVISPNCLPGDAELYGNWVWHRYPNMYTPIRLLNWMNGKYESGRYTTEEIEEVLRAPTNADTISIHSWGYND